MRQCVGSDQNTIHEVIDIVGGDQYYDRYIDEIQCDSFS